MSVVTGASAGLGEQTALNLHTKGSKVYIACRSEERALEAMKRINSKSKGKEESLIYLPFDLTDLKTIKEAAETIKSKEERLDIVVCNAVSFQFSHLSLLKPLIICIRLYRESWLGLTRL